MKRLLLHLLLVLALTMTTQVWGQSTVTLAQPSGSGTSTDPYLIGSPGELFWFAGLVNGTLNDGIQKNAQAHARLTADITLNEGTFSVSRAEVSSGDTKYYNHTLYYAGKAFNGFSRAERLIRAECRRATSLKLSGNLWTNIPVLSMETDTT